jgi:hypothetical protein
MHKPSLKKTQFALMIVDGLTGIVFNTDLDVYTNDDKNVIAMKG